MEYNKGYSHQVTWESIAPLSGIKVVQSFRTTPDALKYMGFFQRKLDEGKIISFKIEELQNETKEPIRGTTTERWSGKTQND
jgi:hypothetical protein